MPITPRARLALALQRVPLSLALLASGTVLAQPNRLADAPPPATSASVAVRNSELNGALFYQLFLAETELRRGQVGNAHQIMLDAARRSRDEALFQRAVDMAFMGRAPDQALKAIKAWRQTLPQSKAAMELQSQLVLALDRPKELKEPLRALIEAAPQAERAHAMARAARYIPAGKRATEGAQALDEALSPWKTDAGAADVSAASARAWLIAGQPARALALAREALQIRPDQEHAAAVAVDLLGQEPEAAALVQAYAARPTSTPLIRLGYARWLTSTQRYPQALDAIDTVIRDEPKLIKALLLKGALQLELDRPAEATRTLKDFLEKEEAQTRRPSPTDTPDDETPPEASAARSESDLQDLSQAHLMLAQAAEKQHDPRGAQRWLERLAEVQNSPSLTLRRAQLLSQQGQVSDALKLMDSLPETSDDEWRLKISGRATVLREARQWQAAYDTLERGRQRLPNDADLMYDQALLAEKLQRHADMERLLRRVIELRPDQPHAYNALGYSYADRHVRLDEARTLVTKALSLAPDDAFITDSAGWVEFRAGNLAEAERLLRKAYERRADPEIATHLGEVLWAAGRRDEARALWQGVRKQDARNDVLMETLTRLKVRL